MISVVIPLYNKAQSITLALNTVLKQSYQDFEIIVINDGSTDDSVAKIEKFTDSRIHLIHQANAGVSSARNRGIREAQGEYIALLDADDEWHPDYLYTQMLLAEEYPNCDVFATNYQFCDVNGNLSATIIRNIPFSGNNGVLTNYFEVASTSHPPLWTSAVMARKEALLSVGGFPVGIRSGEDLLTWARLACRYNIAFSRKICSIYNLGDGYNYSNLPPRRQDENDPVGYELKKLMSHHPNIKWLKKYISHWHKMRASVAVRYGERVETIRESCFCLWYNPLNYKIIPLFVLALIPSCLRMALIHRYKNR